MDLSVSYWYQATVTRVMIGLNQALFAESEPVRDILYQRLIALHLRNRICVMRDDLLGKSKHRFLHTNSDRISWCALDHIGECRCSLIGTVDRTSNPPDHAFTVHGHRLYRRWLCWCRKVANGHPLNVEQEWTCTLLVTLCASLNRTGATGQ